MASSTNDILAVIMGGGHGARLHPLTQVRSKPAVPIAGKYRMIDIPISNCINSRIYRIAILTQFNSVSLHRHISRAYRFDAFHAGWVQVWAAEQTLQSADWYQGTAEAVRKQLWEIGHGRPVRSDPGGRPPVPHGLPEDGGIPLGPKGGYHSRRDPVPRHEAPRLGILKCESDGRISDSSRNPRTPP